MHRITLPELKATADVEIVHDNIRAVATLYYIYQHEKMGVFQVVDRLAELFHQGLLPLGGGAAETLRAYMLGEHSFSDNERADLYEWALGAPGGGPDVQPNSDFRTLWLVFVAEVVAFARERGPFELVWPETPNNATLRKATRDLAANISSHGWGMGSESARLAGQLREAIDVLRMPQLQQTFRARDAWQVIERVQHMHLGGAADVARYGRIADAGRRIFGWLANYAELKGRPTIHDAELVDACEAWLAVSGTAEEAAEPSQLQVEPFLPTQPMKPTQPAQPAAAHAAVAPSAIASDLIDALGFGSLGGRPMLPPEGLVACFHGAPRTGKTLGAYLLAHALRLSVVRVDLVSLATATMAATEKHLAAAFYAAEQVGGVLLFDDAAPIFGRRTVTAHIYDRYANLDVPALVQRIEAYPGMVILATNMHLASDGSFAPRGRRRTWRVLHFPRPAVSSRG